MRKHPGAYAPRLAVERLEDRLAPAVLTESGAVLTITLDSANEALSITSLGSSYGISTTGTIDATGLTGGSNYSGSSTAGTLTPAAAITQIDIVDGSTGNSVIFTDSGANLYADLFNLTLDAPTSGAISFSGASTFSAGLSAATAGGVIGFGATAHLTATGTANLTLNSGGGGLALADVTLATGTLAVTAAGDITQLAGAKILSSGQASFTIANAAGDVLLGEANNIGGTVTVTQSGGAVQNLLLRNLNVNASAPSIPLLTLTDYTLIFDNNAISLSATVVSGRLTLEAGGAIAQTGNLSGASASFTTTGAFGISLGGIFANTFSGAVSLNAPNADRLNSVVFKSSGNLLLDDSDLGMASLFVTAQNNITQSAGTAITQKPNGGSVTFFSIAGNLVDLDAAGTAQNVFSGNLNIVGGSVTTVALDNGYALAAFPGLPFPLTNLTLRFDNAPLVLPFLSSGLVTNLTVTAQGIMQNTGALNAAQIAGVATFDAGSFPLLLTNASNDFNTLIVRNSGPNAVAITDIDDIQLGTSSVGTGTLTVTAGGVIAQSGPLTQQANAASASVTAGTFAITLNDPGNDFTGAVVFNSTGPVTVVDQSSITLGASTLGGNLTVTANDEILQTPGSTLNVTGSTTLAADGITLVNPTNVFTGPVAVTANSDASIRSSTAVVVGASTVSGILSITAGGTIMQSGAISAIGAAFAAGTSDITLNDSGNDFDFGGLALSTTGNVSVTDANDVCLGAIEVGGGTLTITAPLGISENGVGFIRQTGAGLVTLNSGGSFVILDGPGNLIRGNLAVQADDATVQNDVSLTFTANSTMVGDVVLDVAGVLTLPTTTSPLNPASLTATARRTDVSQNITTSNGDINFFGAVAFTAGVALNASAGGHAINFNGDVSTVAALSFTTTTAVNLNSGVWNQGGNGIVIIGGGDLNVGNGIERAVFIMGGSASILMPSGDVIVNANATFQVGVDDTLTETVTIASGSGNLTFNADAELLVGMGTTNDSLILSGSGTVLIQSDAVLTGSGLADSSATPVLSAPGGLVTGTFAGTVDAAQAPHDFLMGTDIAKASYGPTAVSIQQGGVESATGVVTGFEEDGDKYTIAASTKANAHLVMITDVFGNLAVVVRGVATATPAVTLTITTTKGAGDGVTEIGGMAINRASSATVKAATTDVTGDILVAGRLTSLNVRDVSEGMIRGRGANTQTTTITGRVFTGVEIDLLTVLSTLSLKAGNDLDITAERFGNISVTGSATAGIVGNLSANLVNRNTAGSSMALTSASIAGDLSGDWDLNGAVGNTTLSPTAITARTTTDWNLGLADGPGVRNPGLLGKVTGLKLGVVENSSVRSSSRVNSIAATSWIGGKLEAMSWGTITLTGNTSMGDTGNLSDVTLVATGNFGGTARQGLTTLSVAGRLIDSELEFRNGNVGTISVLRDISNTTIEAVTAANVGVISTLKAAAWTDGALEAKSVTSFKLVGNTAAGIFGDLDSVDILVHGVASQTSAALGTFFAQRNVSDSTFMIENGSLTSFTVTRELTDSSVTLQGLTGGTIGTIKAGLWQNDEITALSIGTMQAARVAATVPNNAFLPGDMINTAITAFRSSGVTPGIGTLSVAGTLDLDTAGIIRADNGITTLTVGRDVVSAGAGVISVNNSSTTSSAVGRIGTLKVGAWQDVDLLANTLQNVTITGYSVTENNTTNLFSGDLVDSRWTVRGATLTAPIVGIGALTISGNLQDSQLNASSGMTSLTVSKQVFDGSFINVDNPLNNPVGRIGTLSMGQMSDSRVRATTLGTLKTIGGTNLTGNIDGSDITVTGSSASTLAIGTVSVAGGIVNGTTFHVNESITTFKVTRGVSDARIGAALAGGSSVSSFSAASIEDSEFIANHILKMTVLGNAGLGIVGNVSDSRLTITGSIDNTGFGSFTASGTVLDSTFNVLAGGMISFTSSRFLGSDLLIGFHMPKPANITATPAAADWLPGNNYFLVSFKTTMPLSLSNVANTASFRDSNVVAARLGVINLAGIDTNVPADSVTVTFGVAWRTSAGTAAAGTLIIDGTVVTPPLSGFYQDGKFRYGGLSN